jgi:hypothetical protein
MTPEMQKKYGRRNEAMFEKHSLNFDKTASIYKEEGAFRRVLLKEVE